MFEDELEAEAKRQQRADLHDIRPRDVSDWDDEDLTDTRDDGAVSMTDQRFTR